MRIKDALSNVHKEHADDSLIQLTTIWGENLDIERVVISEYGGYACHIAGHSSVERVFGYKKFDTLEDVSKAYKELYEGQVLPLIEKGLSGVVYTQLSDVEEEVNGLVTYDRKVVKIK